MSSNISDAGASLSMFSATDGRFWRPTLEKTDIPLVQGNIEEARDIVKHTFGCFTPRHYRCTYATLDGPEFAQTLSIHSDQRAGSMPVIVAEDFRGIEHVLFKAPSISMASLICKQLSRPPEKYDSRQTKLQGEWNRVISEVAHAIFYGHYHWPNMFDLELPTPPDKSRWARAFMSDSYTLVILGAQITEHLTNLYIKRHFEKAKS